MFTEKYLLCHMGRPLETHGCFSNVFVVNHVETKHYRIFHISKFDSFRLLLFSFIPPGIDLPYTIHQIVVNHPCFKYISFKNVFWRRGRVEHCSLNRSSLLARI